MPTVNPGSKVLVTGANGFIAVWLVRELLEQGFSVRGTVRSASKAAYLEDKFKQYTDKLEIVVLEDITADGAFDDAVKDVDAIEHTASPFHYDADDPEELIVPAVKGTVGILQSALKYGSSSLKRIVITSSCAAVMTVKTTPDVFSESNWNDGAIEQVKAEGKNAPGIAKYRASKTLAERAAWEFFEQHKAKISWDLTVINPPFIFGPVIHDVPNISSLNTSSKDFWQIVVTGEKKPGDLAKLGSCWVDVRDLAIAFVLALQKERAGGERVIISAGPYVWQDWVDIATSLDPSPLPVKYVEGLAKGVPGAGKTAVYHINYDTAKEKKLFGIKFRTMKETVYDIFEDFKTKGW